MHDSRPTKSLIHARNELALKSLVSMRFARSCISRSISRSNSMLSGKVERLSLSGWRRRVPKNALPAYRF